MSDSLQPHGLWPARFLCPGDFSRQEYWSGLPFPPPRNLPEPGTEPTSPTLTGGFLTPEPNMYMFMYGWFALLYSGKTTLQSNYTPIKTKRKEKFKKQAFVNYRSMCV